MNNNNNHKNMGDEFMDGLGRSINDAMHIARATGLDKQMNKDIKNLKGYTDDEISEMDLAVLRKECKRFHTRFIVLAICAAVMIMASLANIEAMFGTILLGIISAVVSFRDYKQYKKFKAKIDEYYK
jgi:Flp pilus assembly protein TadB